VVDGAGDDATVVKNETARRLAGPGRQNLIVDLTSMSLTRSRLRRNHFPHIAQSRYRLHIFSNTAFVFFDRNGCRPISLAVTDDVKGIAFAMRAVAAGAKFFMTWEEQR
jgi:hypothetical protein